MNRKARPYRVKPKRWWSLKDRRSAKVAEAVLAHHADEIQRRVLQEFREVMLTGQSKGPGACVKRT